MTDLAQPCPGFVELSNSTLDWLLFAQPEDEQARLCKPTVKGVKNLPSNKRSWGTSSHHHITELAHVGLDKTPKPWPNPNPSADPIYSGESRNIFLRLQRQLLRNRTFDSSNELTFLKPLPPPDDMDVQMVDSRYITYFLSEVPRLLGCICCFPQMVNIFMQSVNQPILRHSILALSSAMMRTDGRLSYTRRNVHRVIPQIQQAITRVDIDNSHIVSVTFLAWLSLTTGDLITAHRHVRGLFSMLQLTHHLTATGEPIRREPNPLVMFLFRMAVKADNTLGCRNWPYVFPILRDQESYHRRWLQSATSSEVHLQYCLATIKLDDIANNIGHHCNIDEVRKEQEEWISRPYIQRHIRGNDEVTSETHQGNQFLSHRPYVIFDPLVAHMHLIHSSLIVHTNMESGHAEQSFDAAILVCRIFAALDDALGGKAGSIGSNTLTALWFAGLVFADRNYPAGFQWVTRTLLEIDDGNVYSSATKLSDALVETVRTNGDPWEVVGNIYNRMRKFETEDSSGYSPGSSTSGHSSGFNVE